MAVAGTLIHDAQVITVDEHRRELSSAWVLIDGATIAAVSTDPIDDLPTEVTTSTAGAVC